MLVPVLPLSIVMTEGRDVFSHSVRMSVGGVDVYSLRRTLSKFPSSDAFDTLSLERCILSALGYRKTAGLFDQSLLSLACPACSTLNSGDGCGSPAASV